MCADAPRGAACGLALSERSAQPSTHGMPIEGDTRNF